MWDLLLALVVMLLLVLRSGLWYSTAPVAGWDAASYTQPQAESYWTLRRETKQEKQSTGMRRATCLGTDGPSLLTRFPTAGQRGGGSSSQHHRLSQLSLMAQGSGPGRGQVASSNGILRGILSCDRPPVRCRFYAGVLGGTVGGQATKESEGLAAERRRRTTGLD